MISFSELGSLGRMGNQLFQYSYLRSQASSMGVEYACPAWIGDEIFNLSETRRVISDIPCKFSYKEPIDYCGYNLSALSISDDTDVRGFFQTSRYFSADTRAWFQFKNINLQPQLSEFTSIHFRFGDYMSLKHVYPEPTVDYYQQAINRLGTTKLAVFSDDISQAESKIRMLSGYEEIIFSEQSAPDDLQAIASCGSHIISNSSFSWWGAWLSNNRQAPVICPKLWFSPEWTTQNDDICPGLWQLIS